MSRISMITEDQASPEVKEIFGKIQKNGARIMNLYRVLAHNHRVLLNSMRLANALLNGTELPPRLRELAILRVARLTGSEYEWRQHLAIALELGITQDQIDAITQWKTSRGFSDLDRAVLQYTDEVTQNVKVTDATFTTLRQHLSERSIVELTLSIGHWGMLARFLVPLQIDIDIQPIGSVKDLMGRKG
ncbi:MAG: carboxymuconolactone decarboxylase family protein [Chloroflexi bacterium]|nr:carboxymuconolactone decarboxylase family protein [Chloroflexota bacterium]